MKPIPTETATDVGSVGKWLGAAAAGALLMYLLDPERGAARRSRAVSAVHDAGVRTGASVDHALHSAGHALARGAERLQREARPLLGRVERGAHRAAERIEDRAGRVKEGLGGSRNTYEASRRYDAGNEHAALLGGSVLGLFALMRRSPAGLLVGVAGLALLLMGSRTRPHKVERPALAAAPERDKREPASFLPQDTQPGGQYLH